jgi:hypothetical protein
MIQKIVSFLSILMLVSAGFAVAATPNLTVSGATKYQTMNGVGSNIHACHGRTANCALRSMHW